MTEQDGKAVISTSEVNHLPCPSEDENSIATNELKVICNQIFV